jgi:hypothetical protein
MRSAAAPTGYTHHTEGRGKLYNKWISRLPSQQNALGPFTIQAWSQSFVAPHDPDQYIEKWAQRLQLPNTLHQRLLSNFSNLLRLRINTFWQLFVFRKVLELLNRPLSSAQAYDLLDFGNPDRQRAAMKQYKNLIVGNAPFKKNDSKLLRPIVRAWYQNVTVARQGIDMPNTIYRSPWVSPQQVQTEIVDQDYVELSHIVSFKTSYELCLLHQQRHFPRAKFHNALNFLITNDKEKEEILKHYKSLLVIGVTSPQQLSNFFLEHYMMWSAELVILAIDPEVSGQNWPITPTENAAIQLFQGLRHRGISVIMLSPSSSNPNTPWNRMMDRMVETINDYNFNFLVIAEAAIFFILGNFGLNRLTRNAALSMVQDMVQYIDESDIAEIPHCTNCGLTGHGSGSCPDIQLAPRRGRPRRRRGARPPPVYSQGKQQRISLQREPLRDGHCCLPATNTTTSVVVNTVTNGESTAPVDAADGIVLIDLVSEVFKEIVFIGDI